MLIVTEFSFRFAVPSLDPTSHLKFEPETAEIPVTGKPNASYRQIKNTGDFDLMVRFNKYGLRDTKDVALARENDFVSLGNSFIFGWGVKETDRVSERLQNYISVPVYTAATLGTLDASRKQLDYVRKLGGNPGHILLFLTMESNILNYDAINNSNEEKIKEEENHIGLYQIKIYLTEHSATYFLLTTLIQNNSFLKNIAVSLGLIVPNLQGIHETHYDEVAIQSTIRHIQELFSNENIIVVTIPNRALWHGEHQKDADKIHNAIISGLKTSKINFIDLRPFFEEGDNPLQYHFKNDGHWSPAGHDLAARKIAEYLKSNHLIKGATN